MSYVIDVYRGSVPPQKDFFSLALYVSMFPQLVAGPIVRYNSVEKEIKEREESWDDFCQGASRFIIGLSKKVLLADFLGGIADKIFTASEYGHIAVATAWIGALAYTLEIYYDFSGYSDMAIGLGRCFGFHYDENFNYPYMAKSVSEFWRRWHISLTSWFRDYVYIPLGGNRTSKSKHIINLLIVWTFTGIWHGADWTFVLWGLVYFVFQVAEKYTGFEKRTRKEFHLERSGTNLMKTVRGGMLQCYTMFVVALNWVLFRSSNLANAYHYFGDMFLAKGGLWDDDSALYIKSGFIVISIGMVGCFPVIKRLEEKADSLFAFRFLFLIGKNLLLIVLLVSSLLVAINGMYSPFIYFNF